MNSELKPKIRFKGFTDDWKQHKLEDFGRYTGGTSIESEFVENGKYKVISIGSYSETSKYNDQGIRCRLSDKTMNKVLNKDDLTMILNDKTASGNIIGRVLIIDKSGEYVYNQRTERIEPNIQEYYPQFLYHMLNAPNIRKKIIKQSQGNTQIFVNWTGIQKLEYIVPKMDEQINLAKLITNLDNFITLHQRKCDKLVKLKKSLLEKMFPQNNSTIPEIRFKGFTDDWEQRKLEEIANRFDNLRIPIASNEREKGNIPYYGANGIQDYVKGFTHNGEYILVAEDGANDLKNYPVNYVNGPFWANNHVHVLQSKENLSDSKFLKYCISKTDIEPLLVGGGRAKLNSNIMMSLSLKVPIKKEQDKIGTLFYEIDNLITLHQSKHDKLNKIKQSLLNDMFV